MIKDWQVKEKPRGREESESTQIFLQSYRNTESEKMKHNPRLKEGNRS